LQRYETSSHKEMRSIVNSLSKSMKHSRQQTRQSNMDRNPFIIDHLARASIFPPTAPPVATPAPTQHLSVPPSAARASAPCATRNVGRPFELQLTHNGLGPDSPHQGEFVYLREAPAVPAYEYQYAALHLSTSVARSRFVLKPGYAQMKVRLASFSGVNIRRTRDSIVWHTSPQHLARYHR
jgi:hypothetical protein